MAMVLELAIESEWNDQIKNLSGVHLLQTSQWAELKRTNGWKSIPLVWRDDLGNINAAALILERTVGRFLRVLYVPRGPLLEWSNSTLRDRVLNDLQVLAMQRRAIFIKIDPELIVGRGVPGAVNACEDSVGIGSKQDLLSRRWKFSSDQIQFRNTMWIDLNQTEDELLLRMKQKTRYNIRLAERKGVTIRAGTEKDFHLLYQMYAETSIRDGFIIRDEAYYHAVWGNFLRNNMAVPLIAEVDADPVAGLVLFFFGQKAWYLYGMSRDAHREAMPNYLLQWEAIRWAKSQGCYTYDLWGAPDEFDENQSMWGVYRFKEGLGAEVIRMIGGWDFAPNRWVYNLYTGMLPKVLDVLRTRGRARVRREVSI